MFQMAAENDTISRNTLRLPPAPPNRAHPSPLVDMFNNPAANQKTTYDRIKSLQGIVALPAGLLITNVLDVISY